MLAARSGWVSGRPIRYVQAVAILSEALNTLDDKVQTSRPFDAEIALAKRAIEPLSDWEDIGTLRKLIDLCSSAVSDTQEGT